MSEELPVGWTEVRLADIGLPSTPKVNPQSHKTETFELYSVPSFESGSPETVQGIQIASTRQVVESGDVLLCKINPRINRVWIVGPKGAHRQIASTEWVVVRTRAADPRFLMWQMRSEAFRERLLEDVSGVGGSLMRARSVGIEKLTVRLAPLAEQRRIVERIEALFARTRRARTDLLRIAPLASRYRKRIVDAVLEAGQDAHWPFRTLQDLALDTRNGISAKPADAPPGIPILRISAVRPGRVVLTDTRYHQSSNHKDDATYRLRDRDLLFVRFNGNPELVASCGMVRSLQGECVYPDKLIRMRLNERLALPEYVEMAAGSSMAREHLKTHIKTAAGQHGISGADLKSLPLPVPDVETQREAAATNAIQRATADAVEREATRALALLDHLEQSILARAFRGDLVPQDPTDEPAAATLSRLAETTVPPAPRRRRASAA